MRDLLRSLSSNSEALSQIRDSWPASTPPASLALKVGPLGSGAAVIADEDTVPRVVSNHRKVLGVEMEIYGLFAAATEACAPRPLPFSLKAIVDHADPSKADDFQDYGSYISAQVLDLFVSEYLSCL